MGDKKLNSDLEKFSYALGMSVTGNLIKSGVKEIDTISFGMGFKDTFEGTEPLLSVEEANHILENFLSASVQKEAKRNLKEGYTFLEENKKNKDITELTSGLQYSILREGEGPCPVRSEKVKCHYHGTLIDGTVFDSSVERGQPATFPVNGVIKGWTEALQLMPVGSKWKLFIPPELAYGEQGAGGIIGPNSTLVFEVELLEIV
ncbi:MAG: FKBP-type peptidyl-prolyl cis-trans isomerase [Prolixibacteraceae bacterium]|nr:FKBP-type peptidyl-prolyl cis-trans isomerase [Prolixibacteraceae bacterium]